MQGLAALIRKGYRVLRRGLGAGLRLYRDWGRGGMIAAPGRLSSRETNRSYRHTASASLPREFHVLKSRVAAGEPVAASELLPYLCLEGRAQRAEVSALLADAYSQSPTPERLRQASVMVRRAWFLSEPSEELLPLYARILSATGDAAGIREAYKRLGILAARRGDVSSAIRFFDLWQYAFHAVEGVDRYEFDFDILECMGDLAAGQNFPAPEPVALRDGEKIRLAYLVKGITELNSILVKINLEFARLHDKARFDVTFFTPEMWSEAAASPQGMESLRRFEGFGWQFVTAPEGGSMEDTLLGVARAIRHAKPHVFIASAALADFRHYFVTCLRPSPLIVGLVQGPPAQFAPPTLDWAIAWSRHPLMDSPVDCSLVGLKLGQPQRSDVMKCSREELSLPETACVLMSGGRYAKFQNLEFWRAVAEVLAEHTDAYYVVVGVSAEQLPFLDSILPGAVRRRVRCLGWRADFLRLLSCADVVVDTYPNGGGQVLIEAMSMGLPIVAHRNDYMALFDQMNWSPVEDFISDPEVIVPRGDFESFKRVLSRLITDREHRAAVAKRCLMQSRHGSPEEAVRQCEEIYARLVSSRAAPTGAR